MMKNRVYFGLLFLAILDILECSAEFKAYWNIPLSKCTNKGVIFDLDKFGIIHNEGNSFYGDQVILTDKFLCKCHLEEYFPESMKIKVGN